MSNQVGLFDQAEEPADRWHPHFDSVRAWLDHAAPVEQCQKLRNRPKWRRNQNSKPTAAIICHQCGGTFDGAGIVGHIARSHPVRGAA